MTDFATVEFARNAILAVVLSGILLTALAGKMNAARRFHESLFTGQAGALGVIGGSILGFPTALSAGGMAVLGTALIFLVVRIRRKSAPVDFSTKELRQIGFFLTSMLTVIAVAGTNYSQPRIMELFFGRIFTVSVDEVVIILVLTLGILATTTVFLPSEVRFGGFSGSIPSLLLAVSAGPLIPILGVIPFAALFVLGPGMDPWSESGPVLTITGSLIQVLLASIGGVTAALYYGLPGAPTVIVALSLIATVRFFYHRFTMYRSESGPE